jgi:hypothetical protein
MHSMKFILRHLNKDAKILNVNNSFHATIRPGFSKSMSYLNISDPQAHQVTNHNNKKKKELKPEEYTTYSHFNDNFTASLLKQKAKQEKEEKTEINQKGLKNLINYLYVPFICLPMGLHFGYALYDATIVGKLTHYSLQNFLKHSFLISCVNTGILSGYKLNEERSTNDIKTKDVMISYLYLLTSFAAVNALTFYPMGYLAFNSVYLVLIYSNLNLSKSLDIIIPSYSKYVSKFLLFTMAAMLIFANVYLNEYKKKLSEQGRFEDVVKFYELSSDREFKKVMTSMEDFLSEIDIKVEKSKE